MSIATEVAAIRAWLLSSTGYSLAPVIYDARMNPAPNIDSHVSIHLLSSERTGIYRGQDRIRYRSILRVGIVQKLKMSDHTASTALLLAREEAFIAACGPDDQYTPARLEYVRTKRSMLPGNEYLLAELDFRTEFDVTRSEAA